MSDPTENSAPDTKPRPSQSGFLSWLSKDRATKPGQIYGVPGQGDTLILSTVTILLLVFLWWLVTAMGWVKPLFVPSPGAIVEKFFSTIQNGFTGTSLITHIGISTARVFSAFLLACVIGIPLGLAMGMSPTMRAIFDPPIEFYRPIPPLAYLPLMIIWFGIGETSKVLLIFLSVFAPITLGARSGVKSAAIEQIHAAYSFWRQPLESAAACHIASRDARNSHRHAHWHRLWVDHFGGGGNGRGHSRHWLHGVVGLTILANPHRDHGHYHHCGDCLCI